MNALGYVIFLTSALLVFCQFRRDFTGGLCWSFGLMVALPTNLRIDLPIFELTIQRLIELILIGFWLAGRRQRDCGQKPAFFGAVLLLAFAQLISLLSSITFLASLKNFVSLLMEVVVFYAIVASSCRDRSEVVRLLRAAAYGLSAVAALATVEKYMGLNPSNLLVSGSAVSLAEDGVVATYRHRILLGYAMAMAMPLLLFLVTEAASTTAGRGQRLVLLLVIAACYFSMSRGPWLGMVIAGVLMLVLGANNVRKEIAIAVMLAGIVLIVRPGVWDSVRNLAGATFEEDSLKGTSYNYRWKLWHVAIAEIQKDPLRIVCGYGGLSTESMDLGQYFEREEGGTATILGYTSWDNNYASDLVEFGVVGFVCEIALMCALVARLVRHWALARAADSNLHAAILAAALVFLFAMSNVYIFAPQLKYLFWALAATGSIAFPSDASVDPDATLGIDVEVRAALAS